MSGLKRKEEEIGLIVLVEENESRANGVCRHGCRRPGSDAAWNDGISNITDNRRIRCRDRSSYCICIKQFAFLGSYRHYGFTGCYGIFYEPNSVSCTGGRILFFTAVSSKVIGG